MRNDQTFNVGQEIVEIIVLKVVIIKYFIKPLSCDIKFLKIASASYM